MKTIALYPGSFNPFTIGHLNILEKAEAIFGKENVIILVGDNPDKNQAGVDRVATITQNLPSKNVGKFTGFLTDYVFEKEQLGYNVVIIRGLRNGDDLDYEVNQIRYLEDRKKDLKTMFLICDKEYEHISSSGYRACEKIQSGSGFKYLAREIESINDWCVFVDLQSEDSYAMMEMKAKNEEYLFNRIKLFSGSKEACDKWKKENPYTEFDKRDYDLGSIVHYDREVCILTDISESECHLNHMGSTIVVQRYKTPWIWKLYKKF